MIHGLEWLQDAVDWVYSQPSWQAFILIAAAALVLSKVVEYVGVEVVRRLVSRTESRFDDIVFDELHTPVYVSIAVLGVYVATLPLQLDVGDFYLKGAAFTLVALFWARALVRVGRRASRVSRDEKHMTAEVMPIFENVWTFLVIVALFFVVLKVWQIDVTPLLASAGIAGIAVGFAARDTIANFFGSISLYFDDTYRVGDYITLDSGESGIVRDVSIRSTVIQTRDDVLVTVPNSVLNSATIINQSAPGEKRRVKVPVGVAYGTDVDRLEEILLYVADSEELVRDTPEPRARFRRFGDSAIEYELVCWIDTPIRKGRAVHKLNRGIYRRLREENIEIPYPQRDIHLRDREGYPELGDGDGLGKETGVPEDAPE